MEEQSLDDSTSIYNMVYCQGPAPVDPGNSKGSVALDFRIITFREK